jgi:hypothetical protein
MKHLTDCTLEDLHRIGRDELIAMLVIHDRDGEYSDKQRIALGNQPLSHQQALELAVLNLEETL